MRGGLGLGLPTRNGLPGWVLDGAALDIDFAGDRGYAGGTPASPTALLAFARASNAWGQDGTGLIRSFAVNEPRLLPGRGLLVEGGRQNLVLDNTYTAETSVSVPGDAGAVLAQSLTSLDILGVSVGFDTGSTVRFGTDTLSAGSDYAVSGWALLPAGAGGLSTSLGGGASGDASGALVAGQWGAFSLSLTAGSGGDFLDLGHGSLAGKTLLLAGLQVESAGYSSSPILTAGTEVLRASESVELASTSVLADTMTWRVEWEAAPTQSGDFRTLLELTKVTEDTRYTLVINTSNNLVLAVGNAGFLGSLAAPQGIDDGGRHIAAFAFTSGSAQTIATDGSSVASASLAGPGASDIAAITIGKRSSSSYLGGIIRRVTAWTDAKTDAELAALTA